MREWVGKEGFEIFFDKNGHDGEVDEYSTLLQ